MKKFINNLKIFIGGIAIVIVFFVVILLLDSFQAKIFNTKPFFKTMYYNTSEEIYAVGEGLIVTNYEYINGDKKTLFNWEEL